MKLRGLSRAVPTVPSAVSVTRALNNVADKVTRGHLADLTRMPRTTIARTARTQVHRYDESENVPQHGLPILLVPPLAAPAIAFDLRRGTSLVQHLVEGGRRTYLAEWGAIAFSDRHLGLEFWTDDALPEAIAKVSEDAGGKPVHLVGWCLGGIFSMLVAADRPDLPIASVTAIASPNDTTQVPIIAPIRPLAALTGGRIVTTLYRALGGAPAPLVRRAFQLSSVDKWVTKPLAIASHLDDRDFLEQIEAVDVFTAGMLAYPGRTFGQLYHRFFRANDLASGRIELGGRIIDLAKITVPVLVVAGAGDALAPVKSVRPVLESLTGSCDVRFEICPGGHLGVLAGRGARTTTWPLIAEWTSEHDALAS